MQTQIEKYDTKKANVIAENKKIGIFQDVLKNFKQKYKASVSDEQKIISSYHEDVRNSVDSIVELKQKVDKCNKPELNIDSKEIKITTNKVFEYEIENNPPRLEGLFLNFDKFSIDNELSSEITRISM